jgi:hypothetical protein
LLGQDLPNEPGTWFEQSGTAGVGVEVLDHVQSLAAPADDPECIGAVELQWELDCSNESAQWIELTVFVHRDGQWQMPLKSMQAAKA